MSARGAETTHRDGFRRSYPTHSVHVATTKSQRFDESKQSSSNWKKAMHDLDGASDQDIMFGHTRDETKDAMHRATR